METGVISATFYCKIEVSRNLTTIIFGVAADQQSILSIGEKTDIRDRNYQLCEIHSVVVSDL